MKGKPVVGGAQQASLLLQKKFAKISETRKGAGIAKEDLINIFSSPLDPEVIQAIKVLAGVEGKAQVDLPAMGLTGEDLSVLVQEITAA